MTVDPNTITLEELFIQLMQDISMIVTFAYLLSQTAIFRKILKRRLGLNEKLLLILLFGLVGIYGTYSGIPIYGALANSRVLGPVVGGLLGGVWVGFGAGIIAGVHRFWIGGFTGLACGVATILEGLLGGVVLHKLRGKPISWAVALGVGALAELLQMIIILLMARPLDQAVRLVMAIGLPMIGVNSIGIAIFFLIIRSVIAGQERVGAELAQRALSITKLTLPFLRNGLNRESAQKAVEIIYNLSSFSAVAITNTNKILAHIGEGSDHHTTGNPILTKSSREVITKNQTIIASSPEEIGCTNKSCPLGGAVLAPLREKGEVIGILKLYRPNLGENYRLDVEFAQGLAAIFETQMELAQLERQKELLAKAELKALQAQIHPHFLFNALNTISTFIRTKPESARELLHHLSDFFRRTLQAGKDMVVLGEELEHVQDYLAIETARFGEKLEIYIDIQPDILKEFLPSLIIQPLVENAVRHGVAPRKGGGKVSILGRREGKEMVIEIADNGVGMSPKKLNKIFDKDIASETGLGIGLRNVNDRLINLYGKRYEIKIESIENEGTTAKILIPLERKRDLN